LRGLYNGVMVEAIGETRQELLDLARDNGFGVSSPQLARWHREGLLPQPELRRLGKGRGTRTVYPPGTGEQLLALCAVRAKKWRLGPTAWHLWWAGYDVSLERIRGFIGSVTAEWDRQAQGLIDPETGLLSEEARRIAERATEERLSQPLSGARRRVGKERFGVFISLLLEALTGSFERFLSEPTGDPAEDERRIAERGMGVDPSTPETLAAGDLWPEIDAEGFFSSIGWLVGEDSLDQQLASLTDEQLLAARDEARSWLALVAGYGQLFDELLGRGTLGPFSMLGQVVPLMGAQEQALWTLVWAIGRFRGPTEVRKGLEAHGKPQPEMEAGLREWEKVEGMRRAIPEVADLLNPQRIQAALLDSQEAERLAEELVEISRRKANQE
jgi:hypothetical protein